MTSVPLPNRRVTWRPTFDPQNPPPRVDRRMAAELLAYRFGIIASPRSLEAWPIATRHVNGRAMLETATVLAHGQRMLDGSASIRSGRGRRK